MHFHRVAPATPEDQNPNDRAHTATPPEHTAHAAHDSREVGSGAQDNHRIDGMLFSHT